MTELVRKPASANNGGELDNDNTQVIAGDKTYSGQVSFDQEPNFPDMSYTQGEWIPALKAGGTAQAVSQAVGSFVKIGRLVTVNFRFVTTGTPSGLGDLTLEDLPYPLQSKANQHQYFVIGSARFSAPASNNLPIVGDMAPGSTSFHLRASRSSITANADALTSSNLPNGAAGQIRGSFSYITD